MVIVEDAVETGTISGVAGVVAGRGRADLIVMTVGEGITEAEEV